MTPLIFFLVYIILGLIVAVGMKRYGGDMLEEIAVFAGLIWPFSLTVFGLFFLYHQADRLSSWVAEMIP